ncbi:hypothetical protein N657DRAFT_648523 [Parathielavia appendiculata]|uniref:Uncharacterized protein n=1 Tax=Parathielavia appendiculata TaxID=2587402 RepID=A0AAN6Z0U6_9PEZI|nr:hypothetical protein N657DRAFT_648523 [Parathielavia appendiculata]
MMVGSNKCSNCVRAGKQCSGPNVADALLSNLSEQEKVARDIEETERVLAETLSRLSRLRSHQRSLRERGAETFRRGMVGLEEEEEAEPDPPMSVEQSLVGQAQALGASGVVDWEFSGVVPYNSAGPGVDLGSFDFDAFLQSGGPSAGQGSSGETPPVSQGSGGS